MPPADSRRVLHLRLDTALLETLDQWRTSQRPILYRNEAVERLLRIGLEEATRQINPWLHDGKSYGMVDTEALR